MARIVPQPKGLRTVRDAVNAIALATRCEQGCIQFELYEGRDGDSLYLYEEWQDDEALEGHHHQHTRRLCLPVTMYGLLSRCPSG